MDFENEIKELADRIEQSWRDGNIDKEYVRWNYSKLSEKFGDMLFDRAIKFYRQD